MLTLRRKKTGNEYSVSGGRKGKHRNKMGFVGILYKYSRCLRSFFFKMEDRSIKAVETKFNVQFRDFQTATLNRVLKNCDVFTYAPTGSGQTSCFAFIAELLQMKDLELRFGVEK